VPQLARKVALVTGGASGIGKAIAQRLAADGANVIISDVQCDLGNRVAAEGGFRFLEQDVSDEAGWVDIIRRVEDDYAALHILVNNAGTVGVSDVASPESTPIEVWRHVFAINVEGVFLGCRAALPAMRRSGSGSIINISSVAGLVATPYNTAYGATKAAVRQLTKSVAQHCAEQKLSIRCNSIHPGIVRTPLWDQLAQDLARIRGVSAEEILEEQRTVIPMGDFTLPSDVASAVSFLASDEARHVTGIKLIVDGGIANCETFHLRKR
jgi:3(or 17)beta-hydroxysteroid dehydrogenase